jgi:hypothetical protein
MVVERDGLERSPARRNISASIALLVMRRSSVLMLVVTHETRLWMLQRSVHYWANGGKAGLRLLRSAICARAVSYRLCDFLTHMIDRSND